MRISKIHVPESITKTKNLKEINLTKKPLGSTVALVGKNGAGKSRILHFVENYIQSIESEHLINDYITNIPLLISTQYQAYIRNAKKDFLNAKRFPSNSSNYINRVNVIKRDLQPFANKFKNEGRSFIKIVDNDDLKIIKNNIKSNLTFEKILNSKTNLNEFQEFNSTSTVQYLKKITNEIIIDEFNLYIKNRKTPEIINSEIKKKKPHKLFSSFQNHIKSFLGKEFSYQQKNNGNTLSSILYYNNKPFDLNLFSPGQKTLFAYAILFFYLEISSTANIKDSILIIDEPEKHLHPEAQITLINALKNIISESGQLWIATHSVHILVNLEYDEIIMVKDDEIIPPSRTTPGNSFNDLMGIEDHIFELKTFINSISEWAYGNFMNQCFKEPDVIFGNNPNDPQFLLFKRFLSNNKKNKLLDFGSGKGRIGYTINEDEETSKKIEYFAYEPDKKYSEELINIPNIKKLYLTSSEIPNNSFDCVLLCNVLHEINPKEWVETFKIIKEALKDDGYLLIIEDKYLPKGENTHEFGYLILGTEENKTLLNSKEVLELKFQNGKFKDRISFNAFTKNQINPSTESIKKAIKLLNKNSFNNIKKIRLEKKDLNQGRNYANQTQLHINSKLAIEEL